MYLKIRADVAKQLIPASHKTLEKFLNGSQDDGFSLLALHAKASILLKKAIEISQIPDAGELFVKSVSMFVDTRVQEPLTNTAS